MNSFVSLVGVLGLLLAVGATLAQAETLDPNTPTASDSRAFQRAEAAPGQAQERASFEGFASQGVADDSLASFPAAIETPQEYALLLQRPPKTASVRVEKILGDDLRSQFYTTTFPHRAIGLITGNQAGERFTCTGWLISHNTVATAGHCVHTGGPNGSWSKDVVFYPGRNGAASPYGSCKATRLFSVAGWINSSLETMDYGAFKLDCRIGDAVGWFSWWRQTDSLDDQHALIAGYPGDKPLEQWGSFGVITATEPTQLFYFNDSLGGMSGSPVYQPDRRGAFCQGVCAMAIHTTGSHGSGTHATQNHGTRIVQAVSDNFSTWVAEAP